MVCFFPPTTAQTYQGKEMQPIELLTQPALLWNVSQCLAYLGYPEISRKYLEEYYNLGQKFKFNIHTGFGYSLHHLSLMDNNYDGSANLNTAIYHNFIYTVPVFFQLVLGGLLKLKHSQI